MTFSTTYLVQIKPSGYLLLVNEHETVLEAALRQGFEIPYSCGSATCGTCRGKVLSGTYTYGNIEPYALDENARKENFALFCSVQPTSDMIIELDDVFGPEFIPVQKAEYQVVDYKKLTADIYQVFLKADKKKIAYHAGQHLKIICSDGVNIPLSIANAPGNDDFIELHIKDLPGNANVQEILQQVTQQKTLMIRAPYGKMLYRTEPALPLIFVAGGTGVVPLKAIIEEALQKHDQRKLYLYWGGKTAADLYISDVFTTLATQHANFIFTPVISAQDNNCQDNNWEGKIGLLTEVIAQQHDDLSQFIVYASGPADMVYAARDLFVQKGLKPQLMFSDTFEYFLR